MKVDRLDNVNRSTQASMPLATVLPLFPDLPAPPPQQRRARSKGGDQPLPCAPLPGYDCYRYTVPRTPEWASAREWCDRWLAATDPDRRAYCHDMMIAALLALDHTGRRA